MKAAERQDDRIFEYKYNKRMNLTGLSPIPAGYSKCF